MYIFFQPLKLCHEGTTNKIQVICKISCIYCKKLNFSAVNTVQCQAQAFSWVSLPFLTFFISFLFNFPLSDDNVELLVNSFNEHCRAILDKVTPYNIKYLSIVYCSPISGLEHSCWKSEWPRKTTGLVVYKECFIELLT